MSEDVQRSRASGVQVATSGPRSWVLVLLLLYLWWQAHEVCLARRVVPSAWPSNREAGIPPLHPDNLPLDWRVGGVVLVVSRCRWLVVVLAAMVVVVAELLSQRWCHRPSRNRNLWRARVVARQERPRVAHHLHPHTGEGVSAQVRYS